MAPKTIENKKRTGGSANTAAADALIETTIRAESDGSAASTRTMNESKAGPIEVELIDDIQVLNEYGEIVRDALDPKLTDEELMHVHRAMVLTRKFDARMLAMQRQGQMGTFAPNLGQEATMIGQVFPLSAEDWFAPAYRSFGAQIWRGWPMERLLLLWAGFFEGFPPPDDVNDLPFSIVIGSHVPTATGVAMGMRYRQDAHCVMVNFGDGASSQGIVAESMNFAAAFKAPCVFILENNGWAISTPVNKQAGVDVFALRGVGYGLPSMRVDGNDVLGMITASRLACQRARSGGGPSLIEAVTYRMSLHTTADNPKVYRDDSEVKSWEAKCPILRFEKYLKGRGLADDDSIARVHKECEQEVFEARERFRKMAKAKPREIFDFIYEKMTPELEKQRDQFFARLDREGVE